MPTGKQLKGLFKSPAELKAAVQEEAELRAVAAGRTKPTQKDIEAAQEAVLSKGKPDFEAPPQKSLEERIASTPPSDEPYTPATNVSGKLRDRDSSESLSDSFNAELELPKYTGGDVSSVASGRGSLAKGAAGATGLGAAGYGASATWGDAPKEPEARELPSTPDAAAPAAKSEEPRRSLPPPPSLTPVSVGAPPPMPDLNKIINDNKPDQAVDAGLEQVSAKIFNANLTPEEEDKFAAELRNVREIYSEAKSDLEKRELAHTIAEALTQLGGAAYGLRTGTDMSALKFKARDFSKDMAGLREELQINLADLRSRREEERKTREAAADMAIKGADFKLRSKVANDNSREAAGRLALQAYSAGLDAWKSSASLGLEAAKVNEGQRHNLATEEYQLAAIDAKNAKSAEESASQLASAKTKLDRAVASKAISITSSKMDDEAKIQAMALLVGTAYNQPVEQVAKDITDKGLISDSLQPNYAVKLENYMSSKPAPPVIDKAAAPFGKFKLGTQVATPINAEQAKLLEAAKWQKVQ